MLAFKPNEKPSTTHHAEGNSMVTQTVVGKGKINPLIVDGLLKILRERILPNSTKILYQFPPMEW